MKRLLALYPKRWIDRYGAELGAFIDAQPASARLALDLLRAAIDAHLHPDLAPRRLAFSGVPGGAIYLAGVGFREPGVRLETPVSLERDGRRLTVRKLVATADGTDLVYAFSLLDEEMKSPDRMGRPGERVVVRDGPNEYGSDPKAFGESSVHGSKEGLPTWEVERRLRLVPIPLELRRVELLLSGGKIGDWSIPIDLVPFGIEEPSSGRLTVDASDVHEGVTIAVKGIDVTAESTALSLDVAIDRPVMRPLSIGGLSGMREGVTAFTLRDDKGRVYHERARPGEGTPDPSGRTDVALFEPLPADARELELEVPFVYVDDEAGQVEIDVPVREPVAASLDRYAIRILSTGEADRTNPWNHGPALGIALDLGGWQGDRRVLKPLGIQVDGKACGMSYGRGMSAVAPEPLDYIETRLEKPLEAKHVTLTGTTVQVRGPWRVRFRR
jgi:hypothetical protein